MCAISRLILARPQSILVFVDWVSLADVVECGEQFNILCKIVYRVVLCCVMGGAEV